MIGNHRLLRHGLWFNLFRREALRRELEQNVDKARALVGTFSKALVERLFDPVAGLSMIDRRRIEICRALVSGPRLLLLDEPAGGLNHEEVGELGDLIRGLRKDFDLTILLVEHHMGLVMGVADRVHVLDFGRMIASGTPAEVQGDRAVIEAYLGTPNA
jgi:branched-chain amino acid transport system ATP-binding protein/sulfate-transporting ATPase